MYLEIKTFLKKVKMMQNIPCTLLVEMSIGSATMENHIDFLQKIKK